MVDHLVVSAELRVFRRNGVHAMGTTCEHRPRLGLVQHGDCGGRHLLIQQLIAGASCAIACAALLLPENREADLRFG